MRITVEQKLLGAGLAVGIMAAPLIDRGVRFVSDLKIELDNAVEAGGDNITCPQDVETEYFLLDSAHSGSLGLALNGEICNFGP